MTLPEIAVLLDAGARTGHQPHMADGEIDWQIARWRKMTPKERLELRHRG